MRLALIISLTLALATSILTWVPWGSGAAGNTAATDTLLTNSGKPVAPESVADLRVATFDAAEKSPKVFEVARKKNKWVIPSHWDYPADGGSKVGDAAGAVLNLQRGPVISTRKEDHADLGVIDPLGQDSAATMADDARGRRITLKEQGGAVLIDLIVGKSPANQPSLHYVRLAGSDEVVTAKVDVSTVSTTFRDWVEPNPLKIARPDIKHLIVRDYSVNESEGTVLDRTRTVLETKGGVWGGDPIPQGQQIKQEAVNSVLTELGGLRLVGVRPFDTRWLQQRGFYVSRRQDGGTEIYGNEGELDIATEEGMSYRLFFGAISVGDEQDTAAAAASQPTTKPTGNNRYMAALVSYDPKFDTRHRAVTTQPTTQPSGPTPEQIAMGHELASQKEERFRQFFYVISNETFEKLRPAAATLFEVKPPPATIPATLPTTTLPGGGGTGAATIPATTPVPEFAPATAPATAPTTNPMTVPTTLPGGGAATIPATAPATKPTVPQ